MKAAKEVGRRPGPWAVLGMLALVLPLPSCTLDSSGIVLDQYRYDCRATIQAADGTRSEVSTDNLMMFAGAEPPIFVSSVEHPEIARRQWLSYLRRILEERSSDEAFRAVYGTGPWCVIGEPDLDATEVLVPWDATGVANESGPELDLCSCGEDCGNPVGVVPSLQVSPTTAPYRVDFGSAPVGSPVVRVVELTNSGDGRLCLNPPSIHATSPHPDDFALDPLSGCELTPEGLLVLEGDEVCQLRVTFTPRQAGSRSALVPGARGCGTYITLAGIGTAGQLSASPAPACLPPLGTDPCTEVPIRIDNTSPASVNLISTSVTDSRPDGWSLAALQTSAGAPINLGGGPYVLASGQWVTARVQACASATAESALRVMHSGMDYGAPGSLTGDVDPGSPLVVRLMPPGSDCMP